MDNKASFIKRFWGVVRRLQEEGKSSVVRVHDPSQGRTLLTVYVIKGHIIFVLTPLLERNWHFEILSEEEVKKHRADLFAYTYRKLGPEFLERTKKIAQEMIEEALEKIASLDGELEVSEIPLSSNAVRMLLGVDEENVFQWREVTTPPGFGEVVSILENGDFESGDLTLARVVMRKANDFLKRIGLNGHYIIFFPFITVARVRSKNREFIGKVKPSFDLLRIFSMIREDSAVTPQLLKSYKWPSDDGITVGKPLALYFRHKGKGIITVFRSAESGIYPHEISIVSPEEALNRVDELQDRMERILETFAKRSLTLKRPDVARCVKLCPHPDDLQIALEKLL